MNIRTFPLAWRWTDPCYAVLPDQALSQIYPLTAEAAASRFNESLTFCGRDGLNEERFSIKPLITSNREPAMVSDWLLSCCNSKSTEVIISWQPNLAVTSTWGIFTEYWSEFCYPASDDVIVWHNPNAWVLLYHHEGLFQFGIPNIIAS